MQLSLGIYFDEVLKIMFRPRGRFVTEKQQTQHSTFLLHTILH